SRLAPHLDAAPAQVGLRLGDRVGAEVKDRRRERRVGAAVDQALVEMLERAGAAGGDHRHGYALRDRARELEVVAVLRAVAVHAPQGDLAGAESHRLARPLERVAPGRPPAAVGVDAPARRALRLAARVDGDDDALTPEALHRLADQGRALEGRGVQRD